METNISTAIVDEWWMDGDTYVVYCGNYQVLATDGTMADCHLEVEFWRKENVYHFICVGEGCEVWNPTLEELPQEKRDQLVKHIEANI